MKKIYLLSFIMFNLCIENNLFALEQDNYAAFIQKHMSEGHSDGSSESHYLIIKPELNQQIISILGHPYPALRIRYWKNNTRSLWIVDEIGKSKPITTGIVIEDGKVIDLQILAFRESRGYEVKYPQFTHQFSGVTIDAEHKLSKDIDNVTGATLSVIAVKKLARLALFLDQKIKAEQALQEKQY